MAGPLNETISAFVDAVFDNDTLLQSERKTMIKSGMLALEYKIEDGMDRWGMSLVLSDLINIARQPRKKGRNETDQ